MTVAETRARGVVSIVLIGLLLGPVTVMLWLGRGKLAALYVILQLAVTALYFVPAILGVIAPISIQGIGPSDAFAVAQLPLNIVGILHAIWLRGDSLARPWFSRWFVAIPLPLAAGLLVAFCIRAFAYQPFNIPSSNMAPTLQVGDYVFASKTAYGYGKYSAPLDIGITTQSSSNLPRRGDIVIFKLPRDNRTDYVKRIVGLPGDRVQMINGLRHINGEAVKKEPLEAYDNSDHTAYGPLDEIPMYRETLPNGVSYMVLDAEPNGPGDNTGEYLVPPGHYFMMGDNRDNSIDSRFLEAVGYVPRENLIGRVDLIFWNAYGVRINDRLNGATGS